MRETYEGRLCANLQLFFTSAFSLQPLAFLPVSCKDAKIDALVAAHRGRELDAHYLAYFDCFNRQLYFEAHEVLEAIWLPVRGGGEDRFYRGLIQLAGAFVHLQKQRFGPAGALFRLAQSNLSRYPATHHNLNVSDVLEIISRWLSRVEAAALGQSMSGWESSAPTLSPMQE